MDEPRAKRQKKDKFGRFDALKRLKGLKGSKHKYEMADIDNLYETVDEQEYTKRVLDRQDDDWIVDDDGSGYVEDGREIFDDDMDSESIALANKNKQKGSKRKKKGVSENANKGNLQYMISNMPSKKNEVVKLEDDDVLSELMSEIDNPSTSTASTSSVRTPEIRPKVIKRFSLLKEKQAVRDYMKSFTVNKLPVAPIKNEIESAVEVSEETCDKSVLKEIVDNDLNNDLNEKKDVVENSPIKKSNLLFKIDQPVIKSEPEQIKIENLTQEEIAFTFDDDFDFDDIAVDDKVPVVEEIDEKKINEGFDFEFKDDVDIDDFDFSEVNLGSEEIGKDLFSFYWWDAYEDRINQPGVVVLFGKTYCEEKKKFISCSVVVKNVLRKIYLLPRKYRFNKFGDETDTPVSINDVYTEFNKKIGNRLSTFKSRKVEKYYAFDLSVPVKSEYLEVRFEGDIDLTDQTFETFSRVFGMGSSFLEIFLLDRKIKGPCWLNVSNYEKSSNPFTHVAMEIKCTRPIDITIRQSVKPMDSPPLTVLALNIKTTVNSKSGINEIAMISCLVNNRYYLNKKVQNPPFQEHFCTFTKLVDQMLPLDIHLALSKFKATRVQKMDSERGLLNYFLAQFDKIDPDLIVGHDLSGYQFTILTDRLINNKSTNYSRLSRIKRDYNKYTKYNIEKALFSGRLVCDIKISAKELIRLRSYDLDSLCVEVLKVPDGQRIEIEPEIMPQMYQNSTDLFRTISITMQDTMYILRIMFELNVVPLALQITNIAGNIMSKTLMGGRSERNEFLLLHAFDERDHIVPEKVRKTFQKKTEKPSTSSRKKPTYSGGLVLEPKVGFYDKLVLLMDFNSLYPSIIQEYNICFTTLIDTTAFDQDIVLPDKKVPIGILPIEIRKLVESRKEVKKLMKNPDLSPDLYMQYHIRQTALKLTANSMYGCLGFSNSRFYAKGLAALITQKGREILINTKDVVQKMNYDVIYGDTDSLMINTNILDYENVFKIGKVIKQEINKLYQQVELDIDGVFKYLLLLKKKKYAAVTLSKGKNGKLIEAQEHKGLDIVRRDWSQISAKAGRFILNHILSDQTSDERIENIHNYLQKLKDDFDNNVVPTQLLVITKQLTKEPHLYADKNSLPHVQVALRHNKTKGKKFKAGDTVPYIICNNGTNDPATHRAYLLDELKNSSELTIDYNYYLANQIHPVISRLCEPIEGTDEYQIANCLGFEITKKSHHSQTNNESSIGQYVKTVDSLKNAKPFVFNCVSCGSQNTVEKPGKSNILVLDACVNVKCMVRPVDYVNNIKNQLTVHMRNYIAKYYENTLFCEDPGCIHITRRLPQHFAGKFPVCTLCFQGVMYKQATESDLHSQLLFFSTIFNVTKYEKRDLDPKLETANNILKESAQAVLKSSNYAMLDFSLIVRHTIPNHLQNKKMVFDAPGHIEEFENI